MRKSCCVLFGHEPRPIEHELFFLISSLNVWTVISVLILFLLFCVTLFWFLSTRTVETQPKQNNQKRWNKTHTKTRNPAIIWNYARSKFTFSSNYNNLSLFLIEYLCNSPFSSENHFHFLSLSQYFYAYCEYIFIYKWIFNFTQQYGYFCIYIEGW